MLHQIDAANISEALQKFNYPAFVVVIAENSYPETRLAIHADAACEFIEQHGAGNIVAVKLFDTYADGRLIVSREVSIVYRTLCYAVRETRLET